MAKLAILSSGCLILLAYLFAHQAAAQLTTTISYNPDCLVNASLSSDEEGNLVDCTTKEMVAANLPRCCTVEGKTGCCGAQTKAGKMWWIGTIIGSLTACLMTACFVVFWCDSQTFPCLKPYEDKIPCLRKKTYGLNDEMSDLSSDIKKSHSSTSRSRGLNNSGFTANGSGAKVNDEYAPNEAYDMPVELKGQVIDDWWGGQETTSSGGRRNRDTTC